MNSTSATSANQLALAPRRRRAADTRYRAGIEIGGETATFNPLNMDTQNARQRTWQGHDYDYRDNISTLQGTHLFQ